jgi:hypothetical protein
LGGAGVPAFKVAMATALKEFFNSADAQEVAARCECGSPCHVIGVTLSF